MGELEIIRMRSCTQIISKTFHSILEELNEIDGEF